MSAIRYATVTAAAALLLLAAVAIFNAVVDPFDMTKLVDAKGFNAFKPEIYTRLRLFKAYQVMRVRPQSIILGTSRSHIGFSCRHPAWKRMAGPCYNLAFDGATSREMYWYLRHAYAVRPLKHVLLGLETYHLSPGFGATKPGFDRRVLLDPDGNMIPRWLDGTLRILASLDTLEASIETLEAQDSPEPNFFAPDGQRLGKVYFRQIDGRFKKLTPGGYFNMTDKEAVRYSTDWRVAAKRDAGRLRKQPPPDPAQSARAYVRRIVAFCRRRHIDLRIVITPTNVHETEIMGLTAGWAQVREDKRVLVHIVDVEDARYPNQPPTPIYDFSGYSSITEETPPPPGSHKEMRYYWDSSHFKEIVGNYVLDRVYGVSGDQVPAGFGVRLTDATIGPYLADQRIKQARYRERYPKEIAELRGLVASALDP